MSSLPGAVQDTAVAPPRLGRRAALAAVGIVAALVLALDQFSKAWILRQIGPAAPIHHQPIWRGVLELDYVENRGAAFGILPNASWALAGIAVIVIAVILYLVPRLQTRPGGAPWYLLLALGLVLGGALGNLADRLQNGYVVDFLTPAFARLTVGTTLYRFPTFNMADSGISVGVFLLLISFLLLPDSAGQAGDRALTPAPLEGTTMTDSSPTPPYTPLAPDAPHPVTPLGLIGALGLVGGIWAWAILRGLRGRRR